MRKEKSVELAKRAWAIILVEVLLGGVLVVTIPIVDAHSGDVIHSIWTTSPPTIDGGFSVGEWSDATIVDLSAVAGNDLGSYLYAANNDTHLFVAYDAYGDATDDVGDAASISFDPEHDGIATDGGDDEFVVYGDGMTNHYNYSAGAGSWVIHCSPFDPFLPNHTGLAGAEGFGISPNSGTNHRIFEFSIPLAILNVSFGDTVGFFAGSRAVPGVTNTGFTAWDTWPVHGILSPNEYGNLVLGTQEGVSITPKYQSRPADAGTTASYVLTITNTGLVADIFDLTGASTMGWTAALYDSNWNPLTDTGGSPDIDTGSVPLHSWVDILVNVSVPPGASPGDFDLRTVIATSSNNVSVNDTATLRTGVPVIPDWSDFMEGGPDGWYVPAGANDWEHGVPNWVYGPANASSPVNVWGTNLTGNYSYGSNSLLVSPYINLTTPIDANLTFAHWFDINGTGNDGGWVEISIDYGETWNTTTPEGGYPDNTYYGKPCYAGSDRFWVPAEFNLTPYLGNTILLRYRMWDYTADNAEFAGWYIDNVTVNATYLSAGVRVTPESQYKSGQGGTMVSYALTVTNIGTGGSDIFDITSTSSLGWTAAFYDSGWNLLTDTGGSPDIDTGTIISGNSKDIYVNITIPGVVSPGDMDITNVLATSANSPTANDTGTLRTIIAYQTPYFDDMESGTKGWTSDGLWHQVVNETGAPPWNISHSPMHSWWYGQDMTGDYDNGARNWGYLTSPPIDLTTATDAELEFAYLYETESTGPLVDKRWVEIRMGENPWQGLEQLFGDAMGKWVLKTIDLTPYVGDIIQIRYYFDTINNINNNYRGWYIDDVSVVVTGNNPIVNAWEPGGTIGQTYDFGVSIPVTWIATDDQPMPADNVNITFGLGGSWTEINGGLYSHANDGVETWDTTSATPGIYFMRISAYDSAGQTTYDLSNHTFKILSPDATPPEISGVLVDGMSSVAYSVCQLPPIIALSATIDDSNTGNSNIGGANYTIGAQNWPGSGMIPSDGGFDSPTEDVNVGIDAAGWSAGIYDFYVYGWDNVPNGNITSTQFATLTIIDDCAPVIENLRLNGNPTLSIPEGTGPVTVTATVNDMTTGNSNIQQANFTIGAQNWSGTPMVAVLAPFDDSFEDVISAPPIDTTSWAAGPYDICVYGSDILGNNNTTGMCATLIITPDLVPPQIYGVEIDGSPTQTYFLFSRPPAVTLSATLDDTNTGNLNIAGANYTLGLFNWASSQPMSAVDGTWNDDVVDPATATITTPAAAGTYTYCVYAWDEALNYNTTSTACASLTILDDMPPEIPNILLNGSASISVPEGTILILNATVDDSSTGNTDIGGANYTIGIAQWATSQPMSLANPPTSPTEDFTASLDTTGWVPNTYTICVYAWDVIPNNNTTAMVFGTLTILPPPDTTPPTITQVSAIPSPQLVGNNVNISANVTDDREVATVSVNIEIVGGASLGNFTMVYDSIAGKYYYDTIYDTQGTHSFTIWANDTSDNWNSSSGTFVIEAEYGTIAGRVIDTDGNGISGATVELVDANGDTISTTESDSAGDYTFNNVLPGSYSIRASKEGFGDSTKPNIPVIAGQTTTVDSITLYAEKSFLEEFWWLILVMIIVVIVLVILFVMIRKKEEEVEEAEEEVEEEIEEVSVGPPSEEMPEEGEEATESEEVASAERPSEIDQG